MKAALTRVYAAIDVHHAAHAAEETALAPARQLLRPQNEQDEMLHAACSPADVVVCIAPRRARKTKAAALACIVNDVARGGGSHALVFVAGNRCTKLFAEALGDALRVTGSIQRTLELHPEDGHCRVRFTSLGDAALGQCTVDVHNAGVRTLRGVGGDYIVIDEPEYVDTDLYRNVVGPLLAVAGTRALFIGTPDTEVARDAYVAVLKPHVSTWSFATIGVAAYKSADAAPASA